jgi:hypothetical protein
MIPTMADDTTLDRYVDNIISVWQRATDDQMQRGRAWYRTANDIATVIAEGNTPRGCGRHRRTVPAEGVAAQRAPCP